MNVHAARPAHLSVKPLLAAPLLVGELLALLDRSSTDLSKDLLLSEGSVSLSPASVSDLETKSRTDRRV